ncbi:hypothetical protein GHI35_10505 [Neisseria meningitidis]|uniref:Uncharacterized protein n=2 Tax=Neisseria meningitidis TaxID=487 RepID=Q9JZN8_NEIMB|nr:hypothetical protein NMB0965 [Neisseria meningitidis MC58]ATL35375.1 hypothetical protein CQR35_05270 [Neisseria meningitidis]ATL37696.1 hypothetical protein CQR34_08505 [Neisseria meningitidis]MBG8595577.1 hypothetical protein [Neisseria meningitidis]MBG8614846.1 hypothetical protein [Neisseria meningitidis]
MRPREPGAEPRVLTSTPFCHLFDRSGTCRFYALINFGYPAAEHNGQTQRNLRQHQPRPRRTADTNGHRPMPQPFHLKNFCLCPLSVLKIL